MESSVAWHKTTRIKTLTWIGFVSLTNGLLGMPKFPSPGLEEVLPERGILIQEGKKA